MRQGMDKVSNTFFSFTNHCQSTRWMVQWWFTTLEISIIFIFIFLHFHVDPPLCRWDPSLIVTVLLGWKIFDSSPRSQIYDYYFFGMWWDRRLGNSLNKAGHLKAPLAATPEVVLLLTSNRTKVVWTERLTFPSAEPHSGWKNSKYLIYFMAEHRGGNIKEPNDEKRGKKRLVSIPQYGSLKVALF